MTTTTNPARRPAGLKSITVMADSIDYGDEMEKLQRIWDELVRDVRADAYVPEPLGISALEEYSKMLADGYDTNDTPLFWETLREFDADPVGAR